MKFISRKIFIYTTFLLIGPGNHIPSIAQQDTIFTDSDTIVISDKWNQHGEMMTYKEYLRLTDSLMYRTDVEKILLDTNLLVIATKLYNTTACLGFEFRRFHEDYLVFYWDYLFDPCHKILRCYVSGSSWWCPEYHIFIFGHQFFHDNSRFRIDFSES